MGHLRDFAAFCRAVAGHWLGFVVTGGVGALAAFAATLLHATIPGWVWAIVIEIGVFYACFKAFSDVRSERDKAQTVLERKTAIGTIRDTLGRFLSDGETLIQRIEETVLERPMWQGHQGGPYFAITEHYSQRDWAPEGRDWSTAVEVYIRQQLGNGYVDRFRSTAGMSPLGHVWLNYEHNLNNVLIDLSYRMARIEQFMKELPNE